MRRFVRGFLWMVAAFMICCLTPFIPLNTRMVVIMPASIFIMIAIFTWTGRID